MVNSLYTSYIGKMINIVIDRPIGSKHPKYDMIYEVNYGYVPSTISGDGEELDCYLLGVVGPVNKYIGKCIGIIKRLDDDDDKLIIVPKDVNYTDEKIEKLIYFQEKYFKHILIR